MNEENHLQLFKSETQFSNMVIEHFVIPPQSSYAMTQHYRLEEELQQQAVLGLVDRTKNWLELDDAVQIERIKAVLLLETVAHYLYEEGTIREDCDLYENGFDTDGNILLDVYYVEDTLGLNEVEAAVQTAKKNRAARRSGKNNVVPMKTLRKEIKIKGGKK